MQDFALPYWDWSTSPIIPAAYWEAGSQLNHARSATASSVADPGSVSPSTLTPILNDANFLTFASGAIAATAGQRTGAVQGPLESSPHNHIHNFVGGDMSSFMSPLDPIFWAHHGMIDRCWVDWNIVRNHANTSDSAWSDRKFTEFCDENGNPVEISVISTVLMPIFRLILQSAPYLASAMLGAADCTAGRAGERTEEAGATSLASGHALLSARAPLATLHLAKNGAPTHLQLDLTLVQNAGNVPFQLQAQLSCGTGANVSKVDLAPVSPYPPSEPQSLSIQLSPGAAQCIASSEIASVRRRLVSMSTGPALPSDLEVELSARLVTR